MATPLSAATLEAVSSKFILQLLNDIMVLLCYLDKHIPNDNALTFFSYIPHFTTQPTDTAPTDDPAVMRPPVNYVWEDVSKQVRTIYGGRFCVCTHSLHLKTRIHMLTFCNFLIPIQYTAY